MADDNEPKPAARRTRAEIARDDYEQAKLNRAPAFGAMPKNGKLRMRFSNGSEFLGGALRVDHGDFAADGTERAGDDADAAMVRATYKKPIDFDPAQPAAIVTEAWLIASNGDAVCCDVGSGLPVGGGRQAQIPAKHLLF